MDNTLTGNAENDGGWRGSRARMAAWAAATLLLLLPLVAMQFTDEVVWTGSDFAFAAVLLFVPLGVYELVARKTGNTAYRAGVGVALVAVFLLVWINAAVGITDGAADLLFLLAPVVGIVGAVVARFRPDGMARAMVAQALALALIAVIALVAGMVAAENSPVEILGITGFFVTLFAGSAVLFWEAARGEDERGAV